MPFVSECLFCRGKVRVPDSAEGLSISCPRCGCAFTVARLADAPVEASPPALPQTPSATVAPAVSPGPLACLQPPQDLAAGQGRRSLPPVGVASVFLASLGLAFLSLPALRPFTLALGGLALAAGILGWAAAGQDHRGGAFFPAAGTVLGLAVLVVAGFWPGLLSTTPPAEYKDPPPDLTSLRAVPIVGQGEQPAPEWVNAATHAVQQGDLRVRVVRAAVAPVTIGNLQPAPPPEYLLQIAIRVYNAGASRRLEYRGWGRPAGPAGQAVVLRDDRGRTYPPRHYDPAVEVVGQLRSATIGPLARVEDLLLFDPPTAEVEFLRLELPAAAAGGTGTLRLQIPRSLFRGP
jgi:hypothetical protein